MDRSKQARPNFPLSAAAKGPGGGWLPPLRATAKLTCVALLCLAGCRSKSLKPEPSARGGPNLSPTAPASSLTGIGQSSQPHFSEDGKFLLFVSWGRPEHQTSQVYELNLASRLIRRVTFQSGDASYPSYFNRDRSLLYASNTDELKEGRLYLNQIWERFAAQKPAPHLNSPTPSSSLGPTLTASEIYTSRRDGSEIRRLTQSPGYDSQPTAHPKDTRIAFTTIRRGQLELFVLNPKSLKAHPLIKNSLPVDEAAYSSDGQRLTWVEWAKDFKTSKIYIGNSEGKNGQSLELPTGVYRAPRWHPSGMSLIFSARPETSAAGPEAGLNLFIYELERKCLRALTRDGQAHAESAVRPDGKQLAYASKRGGSSYQLYLLDLMPSNDCLTAAQFASL